MRPLLSMDAEHPKNTILSKIWVMDISILFASRTQRRSFGKKYKMRGIGRAISLYS